MKILIEFPMQTCLAVTPEELQQFLSTAQLFERKSPIFSLLELEQLPVEKLAVKVISEETFQAAKKENVEE